MTTLKANHQSTFNMIETITNQMTASVEPLSKCQPSRVNRQQKPDSIKSNLTSNMMICISLLLPIIIFQASLISSRVECSSQSAPPPPQSSTPSIQSTTSPSPTRSRNHDVPDEPRVIDYLKTLTLTDVTSGGQAASPDFPGISKDVAAFCSARPSLQIDMASMIVHVKRNSSFNYKLYLFSEDHVFQTGQIVPRDDFRIHAFPVKAKRLRDFWPSDVSTFEEGLNSLKPLGSEMFQYRRFFEHVAINPTTTKTRAKVLQPAEQPQDASVAVEGSNPTTNNTRQGSPLDVDIINTSSSSSSSISSNSEQVDLKVGVQLMKRRSTRSSFHSNVVDYQRASDINLPINRTSNVRPVNLNANIDFDRDDQVSLVTAPQRVSPKPPSSDASSPSFLGGLSTSTAAISINNNLNSAPSAVQTQPVAVNPPPSIMAALRLRQPDTLSDGNDNTAGKSSASSSSSATISSADYDDSSSSSKSPIAKDIYRDTQTIIPVGAFSSFHVNISYFVRKDFNQLKPELIKVGINANTFKVNYVTLIRDLARGPNNENSSDDYQFLTHKLLSDPNTRITAISQIYHDWITRNFYTVVYIQRLQQPVHLEPGDLSYAESSRTAQDQAQLPLATITNDRLIFRGSSANLLGAVQLDYGVRASAFITDKNGLHYFLDFLSSSNKFYIAAVDWTEKPFKFIDSQRFPIKVTRTLLDNEELLLCPPAFCHSVSPVDEIVAYGRLQLDEETQHAASILSGSFPLPPPKSSSITTNPEDQYLSTTLDLDKVIAKVQLAAEELKVKLHLRDWIWQLEQAPTNQLTRNGIIRNVQRRNSGSFASSSSSLPTSSTSSPDSTSSASTTSPDKEQQKQTKHSKQHRLYSWRYKWAQRNDIKARNDIYGYPLTGNNIDAAFRVYNQVHLISANFLITINYTNGNETQITKKPLGEEFQQLSSTIIDPISGVFYDRYANQVFFFKGDRYIGYDYATRKPLEDFLLNEPGKDGSVIISSLPVVGIIGRQHSVDGIYHDLSTDLVHIFEGMKFYTYDASEFKSGSFRSESSKKLPPVRCINTHFLTGCHFDNAFPNPCRDSSTSIATNSDTNIKQQQQASSARNGKSYLPSGRNSDNPEQSTIPTNGNEQKHHWPFVPSVQSDQFIGKQQEKVRDIAKLKLVNLLGTENSFNTLATQDISGYVGLPSEPRSSLSANGRINGIIQEQTGSNVIDSASRRHEMALIYMLASLVLITILATLVIVVMSIYSSANKTTNNEHLHNQGKVSPYSTINTSHTHDSTGLPAPYNSLAQLQANAIQAAYAQHQNQPNGNNYATFNSTSLNRYMMSEPQLGLPAIPSSTYIRSPSVDPTVGLGYGSGDRSNSSTPPQAANHLQKQPYIPQNINSLVVKGRRYDTHRMPKELTDSSAL